MKRKSTLKSFVRLAAHTQLLPVLESGEETLVGGQAVIEGVMMRAPHSYCVAVRKAERRIRHRRSAAAARLRKVSDFQIPDLPRRRHARTGDVAWE